jgi:hypothetical protein
MLNGNISYLFGTITTRMIVYLIFNVFFFVKMSSEKLFCCFVTKKKGSKLIATLLPSSLQHDQHYGDIMFTFSTT